MIAPMRPPTRRQLQVATLVAHGHEYKEIAKRLRISPRTVRQAVDDLARTLVVDFEPNAEEVYTPYMLVQVWGFWEFRVKPTLRHAA